MPTATFVHDGESVDYTPGADVAAGKEALVSGCLRPHSSESDALLSLSIAKIS